MTPWDEGSHLESSQILSSVFLPLADFSLYPFPIINYNHKSSSFQ